MSEILSQLIALAERKNRTIRKAKRYLKAGQTAPEGFSVHQGTRKKDARYYDDEEHGQVQRRLVFRKKGEGIQEHSTKTSAHGPGTLRITRSEGKTHLHHVSPTGKETLVHSETGIGKNAEKVVRMHAKQVKEGQEQKNQSKEKPHIFKIDQYGSYSHKTKTGKYGPGEYKVHEWDTFGNNPRLALSHTNAITGEDKDPIHMIPYPKDVNGQLDFESGLKELSNHVMQLNEQPTDERLIAPSFRKVGDQYRSSSRRGYHGPGTYIIKPGEGGLVLTHKGSEGEKILDKTSGTDKWGQTYLRQKVGVYVNTNPKKYIPARTQVFGNGHFVTFSEKNGNTHLSFKPENSDSEYPIISSFDPKEIETAMDRIQSATPETLNPEISYKDVQEEFGKHLEAQGYSKIDRYPSREYGKIRDGASGKGKSILTHQVADEVGNLYYDVYSRPDNLQRNQIVSIDDMMRQHLNAKFTREGWREGSSGGHYESMHNDMLRDIARGEEVTFVTTHSAFGGHDKIKPYYKLLYRDEYSKNRSAKQNIPDDVKFIDYNNTHSEYSGLSVYGVTQEKIKKIQQNAYAPWKWGKSEGRAIPRGYQKVDDNTFTRPMNGGYEVVKVGDNYANTYFTKQNTLGVKNPVKRTTKTPEKPAAVKSDSPAMEAWKKQRPKPVAKPTPSETPKKTVNGGWKKIKTGRIPTR